MLHTKYEILPMILHYFYLSDVIIFQTLVQTWINGYSISVSQMTTDMFRSFAHS